MKGGEGLFQVFLLPGVQRASTGGLGGKGGEWERMVLLHSYRCRRAFPVGRAGGTAEEKWGSRG